MSFTTATAIKRMQGAIYTPAAKRADCCGGCRHSKPVCDGLRCDLHKANVGVMGVCACWRPVQRRVAA